VGDLPGLKKLGRYECAEQVGASSGFETYRAHVKGLAGLDRSFAVKVLRLKRSEIAAAVSEPFLQAARRSATLADPHIAKVVDADASEGVVFAVTPFMDGVDLARFLRLAREKGVLAMGKGEPARRWHRLVAYVGAEVARGLQAAHAQEPPLVHGALCPGNVFITARGAVRLLDFGLRASVRRPFEPRPRRLLPYIAPELAAPAADPTAAGDMHGLGVLLFELCNGDLPPQGRRASDTQIALSLLPEELGLLIGRLISVSPAARPAAAEAVTSLSAVYADTNEAELTSDLASLLHGTATGASAVPAEAPLTEAPETIDDAPPPPSAVEHDEAYGLVTPEPVIEAALLPSPSDEFASSHEPTVVGERSLIDDLVDKSRPTAAQAASSAAKRPGPPPIPTTPTDTPAIVLSPAPASDPADQERAPTNRGLGAIETATSAPSEDFSSVPDAISPKGPGLTDPSEIIIPSAAEFDVPPATWGARALAALGGQAGIAAPSDSPASGLSLLDELKAEPSEPNLPRPILAQPPGGVDAALGSPLPFALEESPVAPSARAEAYPMMVGSGAGARAGEDAIMLPNEPPVTAQPRGDALLEDELVDAPEGSRVSSPWPPSGASGEFGLLQRPSDGGPPLPDAVAYADDHTPAVDATVTDAPPSEVRAHAFLDDNARPLVAPSYFDDSDAPLPESEIVALPEAEASTPPIPRPATEPPTGGSARGTAARRSPASRTPVPQWAKSPEELTAKQRNRRLIWVIVGSVLGASVLAGGLAGFFVGARGRPWGALLGAKQSPALSKPKAAPAVAKEADPEKAAKSEEPAAGAATAEKNVIAPAIAEKPKAPAIPEKKLAAAATSETPAAPDHKTIAPAIAEKPAVPDKKTIAGSAVAPTNWGKGVSDSAGAGPLVSVSVTSQPVGASVWINGKERGRTPLQAKIRSGPAQMVLVLAGHASAVIDVKASEGAQISKELATVEPPMTGEARFRAECNTQGKLPIVVDGKETGVLCPFTKLRVDPGVHKIGLFVPGLGTVHEKEVTLQPGVRSIVFAD
jgi:serine/threonine protein kinase